MYDRQVASYVGLLDIFENKIQPHFPLLPFQLHSPLRILFRSSLELGASSRACRWAAYPPPARRAPGSAHKRCRHAAIAARPVSAGWMHGLGLAWPVGCFCEGSSSGVQARVLERARLWGGVASLLRDGRRIRLAQGLPCFSLGQLGGLLLTNELAVVAYPFPSGCVLWRAAVCVCVRARAYDFRLWYHQGKADIMVAAVPRLSTRSLSSETRFAHLSSMDERAWRLVRCAVRVAPGIGKGSGAHGGACTRARA